MTVRFGAIAGGVLWVLAGWVGAGCPAPLPSGERALFTSTRCVTDIAVAPDGAVWVGTTGGVLRRGPDGAWRKFTRADGLPSHEARRLCADGPDLVALFPQAAAIWRDGRWQAEASPPTRPDALPGQLCAATWRGATYAATPAGLRVRRDGAWHPVPLPPSRGTHISGLAARADGLWAALYGDGLRAFDGREWRAPDLGLPAAAREITAMAAAGQVLWLGTRRAGVWEYDGSAWAQHALPDEPADHNCQALCAYRGDLFVSTLEDGLAVRTPRGWERRGSGVLSSDLPRQMVEFGGSLYVRHAGGAVDRLDRERWARGVGAGLPRKEATALAADRHRLLVAQWGGWSEFDGREWTHHLRHPELQGLAITTLAPDGDTLWIGTQARGLAEFTRSTGAIRWHDERHGLPDDWVRALALAGGIPWVGTFVGGAARREGSRWRALPELAGQEVTALCPDGEGGVFLATRQGVWRRTREGSLARLDPDGGFLDPEAQALCTDRGGVWVGTRTGLFFVPAAAAR